MMRFAVGIAVFVWLTCISSFHRCYAQRRQSESADKRNNISGENLQNFPDVVQSSDLHKATQSIFKTKQQKSEKLHSPTSRKQSKRRHKDTGRRKYEKNDETSKTVSRENRKKSLQRAMYQIFGFKKIVENVSTDYFRNVSKSNRLSESLKKSSSIDNLQLNVSAPEFLLDLQRVYNGDLNFRNLKSSTQGNTIRSFFPLSGENTTNKANSKFILPFHDSSLLESENSSFAIGQNVQEELMVFVFNISSMPGAETIVKAELREDGLRKMALKRQFFPSPTLNSATTAELAVYEEAEMQDQRAKIYKKVGSSAFLRSSRSFIWTSSNLIRSINTARNRRRILIVKFNTKKNATISLIRDVNFDVRAYLPYFFTFHYQSTLNREESINVTSSVAVPVLIVYCNDTQTLTSPPYEKLSRNLWSKIKNVTEKAKLKRPRRLAKHKVVDKLLAPPRGRKNNNLPNNSPSSSRISNRQTELDDNGLSDRKLIRSLTDRKARDKKRRLRKRSKKCGKRGQRKRSSRRCRSKQTDHSTIESELNRATHVCSRSSLRVDFSDIGWGDWIISPKQFDAYYCSGVCKFDLIRSASASNHAIIQSFVNEFEINPEVPEPCCVPVSLTSISVLYFDENESVVLKVYPDMSVDRCACR